MLKGKIRKSQTHAEAKGSVPAAATALAAPIANVTCKDVDEYVQQLRQWLFTASTYETPTLFAHKLLAKNKISKQKKTNVSVVLLESLEDIHLIIFLKTKRK